MKKKAIPKIPKFKNIKEEARFWDTHSLADYWETFKDVDLVVELSKPRTETLVVRVQKPLKKKLATLARKKGVTTSTLARIFLTERLARVA